MPSQMNAVMSVVRASLTSTGLTVVDEDLARPWGGFLMISQTEVREFIRSTSQMRGWRTPAHH